MAAELGVSLTHRDHAQSVRFVTGHSRHGELPADLDWAGLADPKTTTIFYMGGRTATRIAARLTGQGMDRATPVVIARSVARQGFGRWTGSLGDLATGIDIIGWDEPVLIGVGSVFAALAQNQSQSAPAEQIAPGSWNGRRRSY